MAARTTSPDNPHVPQPLGRKKGADHVPRGKRIDFLVRKAGSCVYKSDIKRLYYAAFPAYGYRTFERDFQDARKRMVDEINRPKIELRAESYLTYRKMLINNPDMEPRDRINAQARIDKLLGLEEHGRESDVDLVLRILGPELARRVGEAARVLIDNAQNEGTAGVVIDADFRTTKRLGLADCCPIDEGLSGGDEENRHAMLQSLVSERPGTVCEGSAEGELVGEAEGDSTETPDPAT